MRKKLKNIILFPWCVVEGNVKKKLGVWRHWNEMQKRLVDLYRLNINQSRYLEGRPLWFEILKNKWYRLWIPFYIRFEFYSTPFSVFFSLIRNYIKALYKWSKLELELYVFHLEEIKRVKGWLKKVWFIYFILLVLIFYVFLYGIGALYIVPWFWKCLSFFLTEQFLHNIKSGLALLEVFFHLALFLYSWEIIAGFFGFRGESEDVTEKIRRLDIFDTYDKNNFYRKVDPSFGMSLFHGGLNLSKEEKETEWKNRESEQWKIEWLALEPECYKLLKIGGEVNYSNLLSRGKIEKGLKLYELYDWRYLEKFLEYGRKLEKETLEEFYMNWERAFEKVVGLIEYETFERRKGLEEEIRLDPPLEDGDVVDIISRYCIEMDDEEETDFYIVTMEPEMDLYPASILDREDSDNPGGEYLCRHVDETELVDLFPMNWEFLVEEEGGASGLYKNLENMVLRREDLIRSEFVLESRWKEGTWNDWESFFSAVEVPWLVHIIPMVEEFIDSGYPIHEEWNLLFEDVSLKKEGPLDLRISKSGKREDEVGMLQGLWDEYGSEVLLVDEIYQRGEGKGKTLVEMELAYLNSEEIVPWSRVVLPGMDNWYEEPYEMYWIKAGFPMGDPLGNDKYWEEEEHWMTNEESTWLVEDLDSEEAEDSSIVDYFGVVASVFCYVWVQSFSNIGYKPLYDLRKWKKLEEELYIEKGLYYIANIKRRRRKRMKFTRKYVQSIRENQRLKEEEDLIHTSMYDEEGFFYVENYDRIDMVTELDYGDLMGMTGGFWKKEDSFGMELSSNKEGFANIIDFSFTFWGTGLRLLQLGLMFLVGVVLTVIDWGTGLVLSLGSWYLDYWWPFLGTICWSSSRFLVECSMVLGSILGYMWDLFFWMISGYSEGVLRERAAFVVRAPWGVVGYFTFDDFGFHKVLMEYWKCYPFSFGHIDFKGFIWEKLLSFEYPTKFFVMHGKDWTAFVRWIDLFLDLLDLFMKGLNSIYVYSWCMAGAILKCFCLMLVYILKATGIGFHYLLMGILKLIALIICIM